MNKEKLDIILRSVEKPSRYTGGELNSIVKQPSEYNIHFAFCFPDVYEVGMSHMGTRILYDVLNSREDTFCERCFAPWPDMADALTANDEKLYSLESKTPLDKFDFVGFTLQHEMCYTNVLHMMKLSGIPIYSKDRGEDDPIIIAGGPCTYNSEPVADFFDIIVIGEGEYINGTIMDKYAQHKQDKTSKIDFYKELAKEKGIYIPQLYDVKYTEGKFSEIVSKDGAPQVVEKVFVDDLNASPWPQKPILPFIQLVHDRVTMEIFRGCTRGCRFCQAGMIYRPIREKTVDTILQQVQANLQATGYDEVSLTSLSSGDYSCLKELVLGMHEQLKESHTTVSLPSLRLDAHAKEYMESLESQRKAGLTLAPEAGSQMLRDVINKNVTEDDLIESVHNAFINGYTSVKLYFMLGLPTETYEDIEAIAHLANIVRNEFYKVPSELRKGRLRIVVSTSCFIPKPHTPFQWYVQNGMDEFMEKQHFLKDKLKSVKGVVYNYHDAKVSRIEAIFAKGDRKLSSVVAKAAELGCQFDSWSEYFNYDLWMQAFTECNIDTDSYFEPTPLNAPLPWDHTSCGVSKKFLQREWKLAQQGITTDDCRDGCRGCGLVNCTMINPTEEKN
ncbi:MAG: TIGR03960 family B12-binding radical SAM protein [Eubacteriales bacterium]